MSSRSSWSLLEGLFEILALLTILASFVFFFIGPFYVGGTYVASDQYAEWLILVAIAAGLQAIYFNYRKKEEPS
jgi:hypothetical protein